MPGPDANSAEKSNALALLETANSASERVAGLHVAFMAVCAYVLVIVFGTTDLDLLMGRGVRLPVVNVDVPIVGFYAFAPYLVVLVHFNLLLQLQLLSRKLFVFDAAAPQEEGIGGLRDRLHIFPYTYYLVGRPSTLVRPLVGLMVSITLVLLPLATLLALQLEFLAYQAEAVTWAQRIAIWLDLAVIVILWPIILHPEDDWRAYWRELLAAHVPDHRAWVAVLLMLLGLLFFLFGISWLPAVAGLGLLALSPLVMLLLGSRRVLTRRHTVIIALLVIAALMGILAGIWIDSIILFLFGPLLLIPVAAFWRHRAPRGSLALLFALYVGLFVPLALLVDGEKLEYFIVKAQGSRTNVIEQLQRAASEKKHEPAAAVAAFLEDLSGRISVTGVTDTNATLVSKVLLAERRRLDLNEQVLLAKPPKPETIALIPAGNWRDALKQFEPINLQRRNLRHAKMAKAVLVGADLRNAHLEGADLYSAQLQGADLAHAHLQNVNLTLAQLQGAVLSRAHLQHAILQGAQLQGANLRGGWLQGANLDFAALLGANLKYAQLQCAHLSAQLEGVNLALAQLQGAYLQGAQLKGADLRGASFYATNMNTANMVSDIEMSELLDARSAVWAPLSKEPLEVLRNNLQMSFKRDTIEDGTTCIDNPEVGIKTPSNFYAQSCLAYADTFINCKRRYDPQKTQDLVIFVQKRHAYLSQLVCESPDIAQGILRQMIDDPGVKLPKMGRSLWLQTIKDVEGYRRMSEKEKMLRDLEGLLEASIAGGSTLVGFDVELQKNVDNKKCTGLQGLSEDLKKWLRDMNAARTVP